MPTKVGLGTLTCKRPLGLSVKLFEDGFYMIYKWSVRVAGLVLLFEKTQRDHLVAGFPQQIPLSVVY